MGFCCQHAFGCNGGVRAKLNPLHTLIHRAGNQVWYFLSHTVPSHETWSVLNLLLRKQESRMLYSSYESLSVVDNELIPRQRLSIVVSKPLHTT